MSDPRRLQELRSRFRNGVDNSLTLPPPRSYVFTDNVEYGRREKFNVGDEVYVKCKVVGPPLLSYGEDCIVLDLVVLDSNGDTTGSRFTTTPAEAFWEHELPQYSE